MKTIKLFTLSLISLVIILLSSCEKNDKIEFGNTQSDFIADSIYKASSDGLLFVQIITDGLHWTSGATIYAGETNNPTDKIGEITYFGSITLPIKKNIYWKVTTSGEIEELIIQWTPIQ